MENSFREPEPFSINEELLEKVLVSIGSGEATKPAATSARPSILKQSSKNSLQEKDLFDGIAEKLIPKLKEKVENLIKLNVIKHVIESSNNLNKREICFINNALKASEKAAYIVCAPNDKLKYKIQGKWTGNEVIIFDEESAQVMVGFSNNNSDWKDVTGSFKIVNI